MPQMMPMIWLFTFFIMLISFNFLISLIFFLHLPYLPLMNSILKKMNRTWLWKW